MESQNLLDEFGELIIKDVRDEQIFKHDAALSSALKSKHANWMRENLKDFTPRQLDVLRKIVVRSIDGTIQNFLWTFEQNKKITIDGRLLSEQIINIAELSDGLSGELYSEDGWIFRFSRYKEDYD